MYSGTSIPAELGKGLFSYIGWWVGYKDNISPASGRPQPFLPLHARGYEEGHWEAGE